MSRFFSILLWLGLISWISILITVAGSASYAFARLPQLGVFMEEYAAYDKAKHGRLAAGMLMEPMFAFADLVQIAAAAVIVLSIIGLFITKHFSLRSVGNIVRLGCILIAVGLLAFRVAVTAPHVNEHLRNYWSAAKAGETERANDEHDAFMTHHQSMRAWFWSVLVLLVITACLSASSTNRAIQVHNATRLEPPKLLRKP